MNNKYKNIRFLYILILGAIFSFYSCEDVLDSTFDGYLSKNPDNRLELDSEEKIRKVLISAYPESSYFFLTEMASDNTEENASSAHSPLNLGQEQAYRWEDVVGDEIDTTYDVWRKYYYAIQTACAAIEAINKIADEGKVTSEDAAKGIEAEARLCRAYSHFILVNLFSKTYDKNTSSTDLGIPYVLDAEKNLLVTYDRGTVEYVYEKIEEDINEALPHINKIKLAASGSNQSGIKKYHWNKEAAYAFAARFFLYYKKYKESIDCATIALGDNPTSMLRNWAKDGEKVSNVDISFNRYIEPEQTANFLLTAAESIWGRVSGPYPVGKKFAMQNITYKEITPDDNLPIGGWVRYRCLVTNRGDVAIMPKIGEFFEYLDKVAGIGWTHIVQALFTADETLLTRAEAYALSGDLVSATKDLHTFLGAFTYQNGAAGKYTESPEKLIAFMRLEDTNDPSKKTKHDYDPKGVEPGKFKKEINLEGLTEDQKDILQGILLAKRALTLHEGTRWFDINRYKIEIYRRKIYDGTPVPTDKLTVDDPRRVFQIPQQMVVAGMQANPR